MKNLMVFLFISFFIFSCSQESQNEGLQKNTVELKQIEDYYFYGNIHNEYLENACINFKPKAQNAGEAILEINQFLKDFNPTNSILSPDLSSEVSFFSKSPDYFRAGFLINEAKSEEVHQNIMNAVTIGMIDDNEANIFSSVLNLAYKNLTFVQLEAHIDSLILEWEGYRYEKSDPLGEKSAILLSIAKKSTEWWLINEKCLSENELRLAPWLAADAVGAAIGMGVHMGSYAAGNGGSLDGCCGDGIGVSMVAGAVVASSGIAGRLGSTISRWWP